MIRICHGDNGTRVRWTIQAEILKGDTEEVIPPRAVVSDSDCTDVLVWHVSRMLLIGDVREEPARWDRAQTV